MTLDASTSQGQYDVVSLPYEFLGAFAENDWLSPIDDRLADARSFAPGFDPAAIIPSLETASAVWAGQTYGVPSNSAVMMMFYRKDLFEDPTEQAAFKDAVRLRPGRARRPGSSTATRPSSSTRDAGETLAGQTLADDFAGVAMTGKRHVATVLEWMDYGWTFGGGILDDAGDLVIDSPESVAALEYMVGLTEFAQPGYTNATWDETTAALQQGLAAQSITWGDTAGAMENRGAVGGRRQDGLRQHPGARRGRHAHRAPRQLDLRHARPSTDAPDAAWLFIQWALSDDIQTELARRGGLPALTSRRSRIPSWSRRCRTGAQELTSLSEAKSRPRIPEWGAMSDVLQEHISNAISGQTTPADALARRTRTCWRSSPCRSPSSSDRPGSSGGLVVTTTTRVPGAPGVRHPPLATGAQPVPALGLAARRTWRRRSRSWSPSGCSRCSTRST